MPETTPSFCSACGATAHRDARFCWSCGRPLAAAPERDQVAPPDEMRPVTALFADVVGSTALGERLTPDEVKALIGECVSRMSSAVEEFGGTVQAYMGDGICAYFGVPSAHSDDPERAAHAALRIIEIIGSYARDIERAWGIANFDVRVGINAGPTAVGLVGASDPRAVALGDTTNVAARLQASAAPGTILIGDRVANRIQNGFALEPKEPISVKGRAEPVGAWRLVAPLPAPARAASRPIVGRTEEVARLSSLAGELANGRGQILLLVGEAGIGKSRLLEELGRLTSAESLWIQGRSVSYGSELLYHPFLEMLRAWLGVEEDEVEVSVRTKLRAKMSALFGDDAEHVLPSLARLLGVRLDEPGGKPPLSPEESAAEIRRAFSSWIYHLAQRSPVVVALENLHWADPASRELAEELLWLTDHSALLVAVTMGPDTSSQGWKFRGRATGDFPHRTVELFLPPLSSPDAARLIGSLLEGRAIPALVGNVIARAEGNPLYIEELLRAAQTPGSSRRTTWSLTPGSDEHLPPTIEGLLVARVDTLSAEARQLAQTAAVIGREFSVRLLQTVAGGDVSDGLAKLLRAEVVREARRYPELVCIFRHGLLQEAVLATLTPARARALYDRVGEAYEQLVTDSSEEHLEKLAYYFYRSNQHGKALAYLELAAAKAEAVNAGFQAAELLRRALKVCARMGDTKAEQRVAARLEALAVGSL